jgi:hypothetical protein
MRSSVATTSARAVQDAAFKKCCLRSGKYDGAKRKHFFPRIAAERISRARNAAIREDLRAEDYGLSDIVGWRFESALALRRE